MYSLMLTLSKSERICRDSDCISRYDYLQAYAPDVYDKQIYFCSPNNFFALFLILSTVRLPLKLSLTLNRPGFLESSTARGGGADSAPLWNLII